MTDQTEALREALDRLDNLLAALSLPVSDSIHVAGIRGTLPDIARDLRAALATPPAEGLDVARLGFTDLLDIADALLTHYPPHTIVCTHNPAGDIGARTAAAIGDLVASCRAVLAEDRS